MQLLMLTYKIIQILQAVTDLWSLQRFAFGMCIAASSLMGDNTAKYNLKKSLYNGDLYRSAAINTEHDRDLLFLVLFPEASLTDACSFSWLLLHGVLVNG